MIRLLQMLIKSLTSISFFVIMMPLYAAQQPLDQVVVIVNDSVITEKQVEARLQVARQQAAQHEAASTMNEIALRRMVVEELIKTELEMQMARQGSARIPEAELERLLLQTAQEQGIILNTPEEKEQFKQEFIVNQMRYQIASGQAMEITADELQYQMNNLPKELQKSAPTQYRIENLVIPAQPSASSQYQSSVLAYFYKLWSQLVHRAQTMTPQQAKAVAEKALLQVKQGASFSQLVTECRYTPRWMVHDLGWRTAAQLPSFYLQAIQSLQPGDVAGPFEAPNGQHLIRLLDKRGDATRDLTHVRQILLAHHEGQEDVDSEKRLNTIRQHCLTRDRFETQAKQHSEDPASAFKGGDLDWVLPGALGDEFDTQMAKLIPGQISKPFKTARGWHIIQVVERQPLTPAHPKWKEHMARKLITQRKMIDAIENWRKELYARAYIQRIESAN